MNKRIWNILTVVLILSMVVAACAPAATPTPTSVPPTPTSVPPTPTKAPVVEYEDEWGVVTVEKGDTLKLGVGFGLSGAGIDVLGIDELRGVELALKAKPEVMGFEVELLVEDEMCNAEGGQTVANKFVANPEIVGVVGHMCSGSCLPASKIYEQHHYVMVSPSCTGISLTIPDVDATEIFNRVCWSDKIQGPAAAEFVKDVLGVNKIATIHDGSPYAEQLSAMFAESFEDLGGEVVAREAVNVGDTDMRPVLTSIKGGDPELIYAPIFPAEGGYLAAQRPDVGMEDVIFMGADGILATSFIEAAGDWAEGVYASAANFAEAGPALPAFLEAYEAEYGEAPIAPFHAHAYDCYMVLVNAIEQAAEVDADGNLLVGRKALRDAVRATADYQGLTGKLTCDENGDCGTGTVSFSMVRGGEWVDVGAPEAAGVRVGQVTDMGGIDDKSFNATAWKGIQNAMAELGIEGKFLESQQQADYAKNIQQFLSEDLDLIVTVGFLLGVDTATAAVENPDTNFAIVDYAYPDCWEGAEPGKDCGSDVELENVLGLTFATDEAAFLAGYLAAGMTKTGKVGTFGGIKIPTVTIFMKGFEAGVKYHNQQHGTSVEVLGWDTAADDGLFTGNFESTDDGRRFAESLMDEGADVILPVAGPVGLGSAAACQERGTMLVGVDDDWYLTAPEFKEIYLTSIVKRMDVTVFDAVKQVVDGTFKGGVYVGTLVNGGVGITSFHDFEDDVPADLKAEIEQAKADLIAGTISVDGVLAGEAAVKDLLDIILANGVIVGATDPNYAPQSFLNDAGEMEGFDIDVYKEVASRLDVELELVTPDWDLITAGSWGARWDLSIGSMTPTEERGNVLWFTDPYYYTPAGFAVHADNTTIATMDDLEGKVIGLCGECTYERFMEKDLVISIAGYEVDFVDWEAGELRTYPTDANAIEDLRLGDGVRLDAVMSAIPTLQNAIDEGVPMKLLGDPAFYEPLSFALDKSRGPSEKLLAALNDILADMHADGTLTELSMKWYGEDITKEAAADLASIVAPDCDYGGKIKEIAALDRYTVQFTMCRPDPAFLAKVAFIPFSIQPKEHIEATAASGEILENPIGTGPYMLDSWNRGESVVFKRFDDYWGEPAIAETMVIRWATEGAARLLELQAGTVDQITNVSPDDFETVKNDPNLQLLTVANPNILYLAMCNLQEPFDNLKVRQAIAMGIDRQRIVDNFYPEGSVVPTHFTPCSLPNGCTGDPWYDFDPEAARALLAEAGFPDGFETTIHYRDVFRGYLPEPALVAVEFQAQLKENLNIDAEVIVMESGQFIDESTTCQLPGFYLLGWGADYPHVTNFLDFHFGRSTLQFGDPHPEIYEPLETGAQIGDPSVAEQYYIEANNAIRELVPMVPIANGTSAQAALAGVKTHARPFGGVVGAVVDPGKDTFVFMQNAEPISLYCGDESDGESLLPCEQIVESLLAYKLDSGDTIPALATSCEPNADSTVWTCYLRKGVKFHDGSDFGAEDVLASWEAGLNAASPYHVGNTGTFQYYTYLWDVLMNAEE